MRLQLFALTFVAVPLAVALSTAERLTAQAARGAAPPSGIEIDALDRKVDPCTDFYQFACGGWIAKNPIPADRQSYSSTTQLQERNLTILRGILETPAADASTGSGSSRASSRDEGDRKKASDYYAACMDETRIEARRTLADRARPGDDRRDPQPR